MMMNFWKRSGHRDKSSNSSNSFYTPPASPAYTNGVDECFEINGFEKFEAEFETLLRNTNYSDIATDVERPEKSRLSKTLSEVLNDKSALGYFIHYMELRDALAFVKFWLDVESFKSATHLRSDSSSPMILSREDLETATEPYRASCTFHDSMSISTDCDSLTAESPSLFEFCPEPKLHAKDCDNDEEKLRKAVIDNAIRIYKKYISHEAGYSIRCGEEMRNAVVEALCGRFDSTCFDSVQAHVFRIMENEFFNDFLSSDYHCKYQIDILTSGKVLLSDILYNETALFFFMEFLEQENCKRLLEFWLAATNFRQHLTNPNAVHDPVEAQGDAMVLYDKYFSLQATCPLGFDDSVRFEIEQNICDEKGPDADCFTKPIRIVEHVLAKQYLGSFVASQLFFKYLSELITTIQSSTRPVLPGRHRRTGSDCSSEISSVSTHNTLLAMEAAPKRKSKRSNETDMNIDTRQLYDPDSLWRRRKLGLALGRVTELGRFETAIEPQPGKKHESRISRVVKKLVHFEEDKAKEEMAWQIAEMIVKDITSLTLSESCTD